MTKEPFRYGYTLEDNPKVIEVSYETHLRSHFETRGLTGGGKSVFEAMRNRYLIKHDSECDRPSLIVLDATPDFFMRNALWAMHDEHDIPFFEFFLDVPSLSSFDIFQSFNSGNFNVTAVAAFLTAATGCDHGPQYGPSYFRGVSQTVALRALKRLLDAGELITLEALVDVMESIDRKLRSPSEITNALAPLCFIQNIVNATEGKAISIADVIAQRGIAYFGLNILEYPIVAETVARFVIASVVMAQIERKKQNAEPIHTFLSIDEWSQFASQTDMRLLTTGRKYNISTSVLYQSIEQVKRAAPGLDSVLFDNTRIHTYFSTAGDEVERLQAMTSESKEWLDSVTGADTDERVSKRQVYRSSLPQNKILECNATDRNFFLVVNDGNRHRDPVRGVVETVPDELLHKWSQLPDWAQKLATQATENFQSIETGAAAPNAEFESRLQAFFDSQIERESF